MALTDETLDQARDLKPAALQILLAAGYAPARRIAHALSGNDTVAQRVAGLLIQRCVHLIPKWRDPSAAENWFYHHAVLTTRTANAAPPDALQDPLVVHGLSSDPSYIAFIRALRHLPPQQREAFILHHGERLNERMLGVSMDCSMQAAITHLHAATDALDAVSAGQAATFAAALRRAYAGLQAAQPDPSPTVNIYVRRVRRRVWLRRLVGLAIAGLVVAGLVLAGWFFREELSSLLRGLRSR
jgi:DNA-directed RNA polymerase specialized sigma24 family protein